MKVLFLDDSYQSGKKYFGHGGFVIDADRIAELGRDIAELKRRWKIPDRVELKWSPDPRHYLRTSFDGDRQALNTEAIALLTKHDAQVLIAVHDLTQCYGITQHGWDIPRAKEWAAKHQYRYLAERFERPCLSLTGEAGMVIADQADSRRSEEAIIKDSALVLAFGTQFRRFERISMIPLMTLSVFCPPIQLADLVTGIVVSALAGGTYGKRLFAELAPLLLLNPHEGSLSYASLFSASALGFGLILFPKEFQRLRGRELLRDMDESHIWADGELRPRKQPQNQKG